MLAAHVILGGWNAIYWSDGIIRRDRSQSYNLLASLWFVAQESCYEIDGPIKPFS